MERALRVASAGAEGAVFALLDDLFARLHDLFASGEFQKARCARATAVAEWLAFLGDFPTGAALGAIHGLFLSPGARMTGSFILEVNDSCLLGHGDLCA
jgi:hypothetical protein